MEPAFRINLKRKIMKIYSPTITITDMSCNGVCYDKLFNDEVHRHLGKIE